MDTMVVQGGETLGVALMEKGGGNKQENGGGIHGGEEFYLQGDVLLSIRGLVVLWKIPQFVICSHFPN